MREFRMCAAVTALAASVMWIAASAGAQQNPEFDKRRIAKTRHAEHVKVLDLAPAAASRADELYAQYARQFDDLERANHAVGTWCWCLDANIDFGPETDPAAAAHQQASQATMERYRRAQTALELWYFEQLQSIAPGQHELIASLLRVARFQRVLTPYGFGIGAAASGANLPSLLDLTDKSLRHGEAIRPLLRDYEIRRDEVVQEFDESLTGFRRNMTDGIARLKALKGSDDITRIEAARTALEQHRSKLRRLEHELRTLNRSTYEQVCATLSHESAEKFEIKAFPYMFEFMDTAVQISYGRQRWVERIDAALGLKRLTEEQRAALLSLRAEYLAKRDVVLPTIDRLYDAMVAKYARPEFFRPWTELILTGERPRALEQDDAAYEAALDGWRQQERLLLQRMRHVLDQQSVLEAIDLVGKTSEEQEEQEQGDWYNQQHYDEWLGPTIDPQKIQTWLGQQHIEAEVKSQIDQTVKTTLFEFGQIVQRYKANLEGALKLEREAALSVWSEAGDEQEPPDLGDFGRGQFWSEARNQRLRVEREFEAAVAELLPADLQDGWRSCMAACRRAATFKTLKKHYATRNTADLVQVVKELPLTPAEQQASA